MFSSSQYESHLSSFYTYTYECVRAFVCVCVCVFSPTHTIVCVFILGMRTVCLRLLVCQSTCVRARACISTLPRLPKSILHHRSLSCCCTCNSSVVRIESVAVIYLHSYAPTPHMYSCRMYGRPSCGTIFCMRAPTLLPRSATLQWRWVGGWVGE